MPCFFSFVYLEITEIKSIFILIISTYIGRVLGCANQLKLYSAGIHDFSLKSCVFSSILEHCLISTAIPFTARQVDTVVQVVTQATPIIRNDHHFLSIISFTRTKIVQAGLKHFLFFTYILSVLFVCG